MAHYLSRARTPTSPSPSPEPVGDTEGVGGWSSGQVTNATQASNDCSNQQSLPPPSSTTLTGFDRTRGGEGGGVSGEPDSIAMTKTTSAGGGSVIGVQQQNEEEIARQVLEEKIRIGVDDLMQLAMCAGDVQPGDEEIVRMKINETMDSLQAIQDATNLPTLTQMVPEDVMSMIDHGKNPDIHTRTFTSRLNGDNQQMRGQANNFDRYRSRLRAKIEAAFPEMKGELEAMDTPS